MIRRQSMCKDCWKTWMDDANPPTVAGVLGEDCSICGKRNHDGIYFQADDKRVADIRAEIEAIRAQSERLNDRTSDLEE